MVKKTIILRWNSNIPMLKKLGELSKSQLSNILFLFKINANIKQVSYWPKTFSHPYKICECCGKV